MVSRQRFPRGWRRQVAALLGVAAMVMLGGLSSADPAAAVGPYATSTASPSSSTAPPATNSQGGAPADPYTYQGSSTLQPSGYWYPY